MIQKFLNIFRSKNNNFAPIVVGSKGRHENFRINSKRRFSRIRLNGEYKDLSEEINLDKNLRHTIKRCC